MKIICLRLVLLRDQRRYLDYRILETNNGQNFRLSAVNTQQVIGFGEHIRVKLCIDEHIINWYISLDQVSKINKIIYNELVSINIEYHSPCQRTLFVNTFMSMYMYIVCGFKYKTKKWGGYMKSYYLMHIC